MAYLNENYLKLQAGYLFPEVARRVREFCEAHPEGAKRLIRCGIGDVTEPLPPAAIEAMKRAIDELGHRESFRGYGPEQGYEFLRSTIAQRDYRDHNINIADDEIFVSDHTGPARKDSRYEGIYYLPCTAENNFVPEPPKEHVDLVYLCFPNNPTGAVASRAQLARWVDYAHEHDALLLFDAAYEAYISDPAIPHSIFNIPGALTCAIELRSFSKNGGFTGVRCGFTVMPKSVLARSADGRRLPLHPLWQRRWSTKSNSVAYLVQRGAEALYSAEGRKQVHALIAHYMGNAKVLRDAAGDAGLEPFGGVNAPYIWVKTPDGLTSWQLFDRMLRELNIVITPGAGFGAQGEGYFRISAFNSRENAEEAARRLKTLRSS